MPVVVDPTKTRPPHHRLKVADLASLPVDLPSGPVLYELDNGNLVVTSPPDEQRGAVQFKISTALFFDGEQLGYGKTLSGEVGLVLWRDPDRVVFVDGIFVTKAKLPLCRTSEGLFETIPDLVVEVCPEGDCLIYLQKKIADLHQAGVAVVLLIDHQQQCIHESRLGRPTRKYCPEEILQLPDMIPDWQVRVSDLF